MDRRRLTLTNRRMKMQVLPRHSRMKTAIQLCLATTAFGVLGAASAASPTRVIVAFKPGAAAAVKSAVAAARGAVALEIYGMDAMAVEVPSQALKGLSHNPNVLYVEEDVKRYPSAVTPQSYEAGQVIPYGITMVQADQLSDQFTNNRKVCIIDSGYDRTHVDLGTLNVTGEYDKRGTGWWYTDENHHGTHVAGTIVALNNANTGVVGVNPNNKLKLHIVKVFGADGWAYSSSLTTAVNKCGTAGANVISMSLGGGRASKTEERAFNSLAAKGVLSIAAAGNDGNEVISYPAGYANVMMVGALDSNMQWADFSQFNAKVEISAPGVGVLSTVPMNSGSKATLTVGATTYAPNPMEGSPKLSRTGELADFGLGDAVTSTMTGKVCLIARGTIDFATKVSNCQASGGVGAVVYNNVAGSFGGTLGTTVTTIPSVTASDTEGAAMRNQFGSSATVAVTASSYEYYDGTSMATPHVSAVAALVWSYYPTCSGNQIRAALTASAKDLGPVGRDTKYGYGLVQAKAAHDYLATHPCN
jgi:subtilisin family serine protease